MKTRIIHTRFWKDEYISKLPAKDRLAFLYFLTNENVNMCGIYELPDKYICVDLGVTQKELNRIKDRFISDKKILFHKGWVRILNHDKYNSYGKGMQEKALAKELSVVPKFMSNTSINSSIYTRPNTEIRNKNTETAKKSSLKALPLTDSEIQELAASLNKTPAKIKTLYEKILDYELSTGKSYKDYKATIRNWLRMEYERREKRGEEFI